MIERMQAADNTAPMSKGCSMTMQLAKDFSGRLKNEMFYGRSWVGVSMDDFINEIK